MITIMHWQASCIRVGLLLGLILFSTGSLALAEEALPRRTTLSDPSIKYTVPEKPYVVLKRADVQAVIVNNEAADDKTLPGHKAGYSGVAQLTHKKQPRNIFVPNYAGLNYEHIHDGTAQTKDILFEPRRAGMELRVIDDQTAELYQPPTPTWKLESCLRYELLPDGTIEMTLECIPHADTFKHGYIGLFWASYINQPESLDIFFQGVKGNTQKVQQAKWIRAVTPSHGVDATHLSVMDERAFAHDEDFPLTLVYNRSRYRYTEPWYYAVSHGMAFVQLFRPQDQIRISQSPSGGGVGNPAWDFQFFIPDYKVGQRYQMVMRAMYVPFESAEEIVSLSEPHRAALAK